MTDTAKTFAKGDKVLIASATYRVNRTTYPHSTSTYEGLVGEVKSGPDSDGDYFVDFPDADAFGSYFNPEGLEPVPSFAVGDLVAFIDPTGPLSWHGFDGTLHAHEPISAYTREPVVTVVAPTGTFHTLNVQARNAAGYTFDVKATTLRPYVAAPEPLALAVGDRAVVESDVFNRPHGGIGTHSEFGDGDRPQVGDVVTITGKCSTTGDYEVGPWRISPEGLVPTPKFVKGDRVVVTAEHYVGLSRRPGAVGTIVALDGDTRGISRPDYAVDIDGDPFGAWGFREDGLRLADPEPEAEPTEETVEEFEVGDKVLVGEDFAGSDKYAGTVGTVAYPKDADGDYMVEFEGRGYADGDYSYFAPSELSPVVEEPAVVASEPTVYSVPVRYVAGVEPTFEARDEATEAKPEDYALRLEVSAKAADILSRAGYRNIYGSDVAALAEFLLGVAKREA